MSGFSTNSNEVAKVSSNEVAKVSSNEVAKVSSNEVAKVNSDEVAKVNSDEVAKHKSISTSQCIDDDSDTPIQRQNEIDRINDGRISDVFAQYKVDDFELPKIYRKLAGLVHPDKQSDPEWKGKAHMAQSKLNRARDQFKIAPDWIPPPFRHGKFWSGNLVKSAIRSLQIDPDSISAEYFIRKTNVHIQDYNKVHGYDRDSGFFPFDHLKDTYQKAHDFMSKHQQANDEKKKELTEKFHHLITSTREYCSEYKFPTTWAWQYSDITKKPGWMDSEAKAEFESAYDSARRLEANPDTNKKMTDLVEEEPASLKSNPDTNKKVTDLMEEELASLNIDSDNDTNTQMTDVTYPVTIHGKPIIAKRKVFKTVQYLLQGSPDLHVWMPASFCEDFASLEISTLELKSKEFIEHRKRQYKRTSWIAMGVDEIITEGVRYPPVAMMIQWLDTHDDSLMWRSDVIKIAGKKITDRAVKAHLQYQEFEFNGASISIMAATKAALTNGPSKAIAEVTRQQVNKSAFPVFIDQKSTPQSTVFKNSSVQSDEDIFQMIQKIVNASLHAALQGNQRAAVPVTV